MVITAEHKGVKLHFERDAQGVWTTLGRKNRNRYAHIAGTFDSEAFANDQEFLLVFTATILCILEQDA